MTMVADFTGKLRLELQLPRSAAKTCGNSLVSGTDLITQAAHLVAVRFVRCRVVEDLVHHDARCRTRNSGSATGAPQCRSHRPAGTPPRANVFIERLWRSVNYEDIYLRAYENGRELQAGLTRYLGFYSRRRMHQSHEYQTPYEIYYTTTASVPLAIAA